MRTYTNKFGITFKIISKNSWSINIYGLEVDNIPESELFRKSSNTVLSNRWKEFSKSDKTHLNKFKINSARDFVNYILDTTQHKRSNLIEVKNISKFNFLDSRVTINIEDLQFLIDIVNFKSYQKNSSDRVDRELRDKFKLHESILPDNIKSILYLDIVESELLNYITVKPFKANKELYQKLEHYRLVKPVERQYEIFTDKLNNTTSKKERYNLLVEYKDVIKFIEDRKSTNSVELIKNNPQLTC